MKTKRNGRAVIVHSVVGAALLGLMGCTSIGPQKIARDRLDYSTTIGESWKKQTLLNVVKLRYLDPPVFLDVGQIVGGYSLQTTISAGGLFSSRTVAQGDSLAVGGNAVYTDRPTVTYTPLMGDDFLRSLIRPLPPGAVFGLVQTGYAAEFLFSLTLNSLNGTRNRSQRAGVARDADEGFRRAVKLFGDIQESGAVGLRVEQSEDNSPATVLFFSDTRISEETVAKLTELKEILRINTDRNDFKLIASQTRSNEGELAVSTRSLLQIMMALSTYVEVPPADVTEGRASPAPDASANSLLTVRCTKEVPDDAYAAVRYRDRWFWIDDRDFASKRTFTTVMFLFTLVGGNAQGNLPVLTIPTG